MARPGEIAAAGSALAPDGIPEANTHANRDSLAPGVLWGGLLLLVSLGLLCRLHGIDRLGLLVDEGNQAIAVSGIMESGLPISDSGWPYTRNLLFQYLQAATGLALGLDELSLRLPSALFGAASIASSFALARMLFGDRAALFTATLVSLSIWEISLSRYGRPYTALQFFYALGLLCFYRGFLSDRRAYRWGYFAVLIVLFPIHEFGVVLATCFAIPWMMGDRFTLRRRVFGLAVAAGIGGSWLAYQRGAEAFVNRLIPPHGLTHLPPTVSAAIGSSGWPGPRLWSPQIEASTRLAEDAPMLLASLVGVAVGTSLLVTLRFWRTQRIRIPLLLAMIAAACLHQLTLALLFGLADLALFGRRESLLDRRYLPAWIFAGASLAFWSTAISFGAASWRETILTLFAYPNVVQQCLFFLTTTWPALLIGTAAGCGLLGWQLIDDRRSGTAAFGLGAFLLPIVAMSFFRSYFEARYIFHVFPIMIAIYAFAAIKLAEVVSLGAPPFLRRPALAAVLLVALIVTGEANPVAAWAVGDRDYSTPTTPGKGVISWRPYAGFHQDHKTPSLYVSSHRAPGDRVIVLGAPHMISVYAFYLDDIDLAVGRDRDRGYLRLRGDQTVGWVTGIPTITSGDALRSALHEEHEGATWLIADRVLLREDNPYLDESIKSTVGDFVASPVYVGRDNETFVARVTQ